MAEERHVISVHENAIPWSLLIEIAEQTDTNNWVLVGGLMVHAHALRAGITPSRPTRDLDLLIDLTSARVSDVAGPLQRIGFRPQRGAPYTHRFVRGREIIEIAKTGAAGNCDQIEKAKDTENAKDGEVEGGDTGGAEVGAAADVESAVEIVDIMVRRGVTARWASRPVFPAPGAAQALERRDWFTLQGATRAVTIGIPDALGAIVAKGAAYANDQRDRGRHLEDLAVLLAATGNRRALGVERLTRRDRQHLRPAFTLLNDSGYVAWQVLDRQDRPLAQWVGRAINAQL